MTAPGPTAEHAQKPVLLSVDDLACTVGVRPLFTDLSFELSEGSWLRLAGPNGCGKSTLLRTVCGLLRPTRGQILWRGQQRRLDSPQWRARLLYQGHASGWKDSLSAAENLALQIELDRGVTPGAEEISATLGEVGLERQSGLSFQRLSAGQRHRLSLARLAMARQPLWLLDEPSTALDTEGQRLLGTLLDRHLAQGGCALIATHLPIDCEAPAHQLELARFAPRR